MNLQRELDLLRDVLWNTCEDVFYEKETRIAAARALGYIATDFCIEILRAQVLDEDENHEEVTEAAVEALGWAIDRRRDEEKHLEDQI